LSHHKQGSLAGKPAGLQLDVNETANIFTRNPQ